MAEQLTDKPSADAEQKPALKKNPEQLRALGMKLKSDFEQYEKDRKNAEMQWTANYRQYKGIYDPAIATEIGNSRSKAYPKLTRVKCISMLSRLMNLMFPSSEKNWTIEPSPVPNIEQTDLQAILDKLTASGEVITDRVIEQAVYEFAKERARNLEREIEDQLTAVGGTKLVNYPVLCRKVLLSGIQYGVGVMKGPMARQEQQRRWEQGQDGTWRAVSVPAVMPQFEFVPVWEYYPDMSAKYLHQMDGQFQRMVMSRAQVGELASKPDFFGDEIKKYLKEHQTGNYKEKAFESELRAMGVQTNVNQADGRKFEVILWDGMLSADYLRAAAVEVPESMGDSVKAVVWILDGVVIRASLNPWLMLNETERVNSYHVFIFEEDDASLTGNGLPQVMRDSQMAVAASARMIIDNASVTCGPMMEVNKGLLVPGQDANAMGAFKTFYRDDESASTAAIPALREINVQSHLPELMEVKKMFADFADQETFVNPMTGGDMQKGPSEPFRTAAGASMLQGLAALPFKDVVRNFDLFTQSVIESLIVFNRHFNTKQTIKGDFQAVPRGSTSLIAKEVRGMGYDQLATSLTPQEALYIDWKKLLQERLAVRDMDMGIMVSDAEAERREKSQAERQQQQDSQFAELMRAEVRKTLAEAVKSLTQADKNASAAETQVFNSILTALEKNVSVIDVATARAGGGVPEGVVRKQDGAGGKDSKPATH